MTSVRTPEDQHNPGGIWPPVIDEPENVTKSNLPVAETLTGAKVKDAVLGLLIGPFLLALGQMMGRYLHTTGLPSLIAPFIAAVAITVVVPVNDYVALRTGLWCGTALTIVATMYLMLSGDTAAPDLTYVGNDISMISSVLCRQL